jgi:hypothetical protein
MDTNVELASLLGYNGGSYIGGRCQSMNVQTQRGGLRHARKSIRSAVLLMHGVEVWSSELEDISATGVLVLRPEGWVGQLGDMYALDMIIGDDLNIHVEAAVARITEHHVGFAYARIPPDKEIPLWNLLGGYADRLEPFED